jgi:hypothetical protein
MADKGKDDKSQEQPDEGTATPPGKTADQPKDDKPKAEKTFTQKEVDAIVTERLEREKDKATKAAERARAEAAEEALTKNQEWKELAEKRELRIKELEPLAEKLAAAEKDLRAHADALGAQLKTQKEGIPAHILSLIEKQSILEQLIYLSENRAALVMGEKKKPDPVPESPRGDSLKAVSDAEKEQVRREFAGTVKGMF